MPGHRGVTMRARLLIEADLLDVRDTELACDLADDTDGVDKAKARLDELLAEWADARPRHL